MKNRRTSWVFALDMGMFLLVCVLMCVSLTGLELHEWLGFVLCPLLLLHVTLQWGWFRGQFRRLAAAGAWRVRMNLLLNGSLLFLMAALLASGVVISDQMSPLIEGHFGRARVWHEIHVWLNVAALALVALHLGLNWDWIAGVLRRSPREPPDGAAASKPATGLSMTKFLAGGAAALITVLLAVFAVYLIADKLMRPEMIRPRVEDRQKAGDYEAAGLPRHANRPRPPPAPGDYARFGCTMLAVLAVAVIARYGFRLRL